MDRAKPSKEEAEVMYEAQSQIIHKGQTVIKCPRCGKQLKYTWMESAETTECVDETCIMVTSRGI